MSLLSYICFALLFWSGEREIEIKISWSLSEWKGENDAKSLIY